MRFVRPLLFIVALLLMVELSFRVYLLGPVSLNPWKMNSFNEVHRSGMIQAASIPAVYFELKPGLDTWYKGVPFITNGQGLRDDEYPLVKEDGTFRVAVLGSSWTMGSGVKAQEIWHSIIEQQLNRDFAPQKFEFINFGVDQYGIGEIIATLDNKIAAYGPDLVIIAITQYTPTIAWPDPPVAYVEQPRRNPFLESYALRVLDLTLGLRLYNDSDERRANAWEPGQVQRQLEKAVGHITRFSDRYEVPVVLVKLAYSGPWQRNKSGYEQYLASASDKLIFFNTLQSVRSHGYKPKELRISNWDSHPNVLAHQLLAEAVLQGLQENRLLPAK
ncbi:MAG: SGNH/GDSL hydrolase family protein [Gammaproteobacteria bacterium]|jgi:hypothetical protein